MWITLFSFITLYYINTHFVLIYLTNFYLIEFDRKKTPNNSFQLMIISKILNIQRNVVKNI